MNNILATLMVVIPSLFTLFGGVFWIISHMVKIETLLMNHLAHHEEFEKIMAPIIRSFVAAPVIVRAESPLSVIVKPVE